MVSPWLDVHISIQRLKVRALHPRPTEVGAGVVHGLHHAIALEPDEIAELGLNVCSMAILGISPTDTWGTWHTMWAQVKKGWYFW